LMLEIQRRYSDFDWLHQRLRVEFPHVLIPPIPAKSLTNRFNTEFLISRCKSLQQFLICVFNHKELRHSDSLKVFLAETDTEFQQLKNKLTSSTGNQLFSKLGKTMDLVVNANITTPTVEVDPWYDNIKSHLGNLESYLQKSYKVVTEMIQKEKEVQQLLLQLSETLTNYGTLESNQDKTLQYQYQTSGRVLQQISTLRKEQYSFDERLEEQLSHYINLLPAAKELLNNRNELLQYYFQCRDKSSLIMEKLIPAGGEARKELEKELRLYEEKTNDSGSDFRAFSRKSKIELQAHFHHKKELKESLKQFAQLSLDYESKVAKLYQCLLDDLENENIKDSK